MKLLEPVGNLALLPYCRPYVILEQCLAIVEIESERLIDHLAHSIEFRMLMESFRPCNEL